MDVPLLADAIIQAGLLSMKQASDGAYEPAQDQDDDGQESDAVSDRSLGWISHVGERV
jgi:hypothetical protein